MTERKPAPAVASFTEDLNRLCDAAGRPPLSRLHALTKVAQSTIDDHLSGRRLNVPSWAFVSALVTACHQVAGETGLDRERLGSLSEWQTRYLAARRGDLAAPSPVHALAPGAGPERAGPGQPRMAGPREPGLDAPWLGRPGLDEPGPGRRGLAARPLQAVAAHRRLALTLACTVVVLAAAAATVPSLISPSGGQASSHDGNTREPTISWSKLTRASVDGSAAVAGGGVYIADDDGNVYALNARTGAVRWAYAAHSQIDSTPCVSGGTVYVGDDAWPRWPAPVGSIVKPPMSCGRSPRSAVMR
jgi:PQQ-like domain